MERKFYTPVDKAHWLALRSEDVTSTEVPALFGLSPYVTKFELWHNHKNNILTIIEETERMGWGNRLEKAIGEHVIEENLWTGEQMKDYVRLEGKRMGSSFDFFITADEKPGVLEIKNVDTFQFSRTWTEKNGVIEAPPHIEIQAQYQLLVSGRDFVYIAALVGGNRAVLLRREKDEALHEIMSQEVAKFWESIDAGIPPEPDFEKDSAFIASLYNHAEPGKIIDANEQIDILATAYKRTSDRIKEMETEKEKHKAMILQLIGDAEKVKGEKYSISAGITGESAVSYTRKPFRNFKINWRKQDE